MRVVFVSTYPPIECGIGTYTGFLVEALTKLPNEIHIVSQYGAEGRHVYPSYHPGEDGIARKIFNLIIPRSLLRGNCCDNHDACPMEL